MLLYDSSAIDTGMKKGLVRLRRLALCRQAGEPGFEPGLTGSEPVVLPLHHSPEFAFVRIISRFQLVSLFFIVDAGAANRRLAVSSAEYDYAY